MNYMKRAVELAGKGIGFTSPNPLVGAVIVKNGKIIGEGYHAKYGDLHAERNALKNCTENPIGADMYVTLEPCCHTGKQPPCTEAVIKSGIKHVFVGSYDPNPQVSGKGIKLLREAGIEVTEGYEKDLCDSLNPIFFKYITQNKPYVILKTAVTSDGKTAAYTGDSKWITNEQSRQNVHRTRKQVSAVLTGIGTVLADNPMLNCRTENPKNPVRIVCDSKLKIQMDCQIVKTANEIKTVIATLSNNDKKINLLQNQGVEIIKAKDKNGKICLTDLMEKLAKMKLDSVLIEAGEKINASALVEGIVDKLQVYIAPKIIGGPIGCVGDMGLSKMSEAIMLKNPEITTFDGDVLIEYDVEVK